MEVFFDVAKVGDEFELEIDVETWETVVKVQLRRPDRFMMISTQAVGRVVDGQIVAVKESPKVLVRVTAIRVVN